MKKINCYSKYVYYVYLLLLLLTIIVGIIPLIIFKEDEFNIFKIFWICIIAFCVSISIFGFFHYNQYLIVKNNKFILKNCFAILKEMNISNCYYEISVLPTYIVRRNVNEKWICIYPKNEDIIKFKAGVSNCKKYNRIQLVYNEKNIQFVSKYLETFNTY